MGRKRSIHKGNRTEGGGGSISFQDAKQAWRNFFESAVHECKIPSTAVQSLEVQPRSEHNFGQTSERTKGRSVGFGTCYCLQRYVELISAILV